MYLYPLHVPRVVISPWCMVVYYKLCPWAIWLPRRRDIVASSEFVDRGLNSTLVSQSGQWVV